MQQTDSETSSESESSSVETTKAHESNGSIRVIVPRDLATEIGISDGDTILWSQDEQDGLRAVPGDSVVERLL